MHSKKSHIPLVPRTVTYCGQSRQSKKKTVSIQTDRWVCPTEIPFDCSIFTGDDISVNEESVRRYSTALQYVNTFHLYMNKKLSERYGDYGDTTLGGRALFKFPAVPNYTTIFFLLLDKPAEQVVPDFGNAKKNEDSAKFEQKKYITRDSIFEFVPEIKQMPAYRHLEHEDTLDEIREDGKILGGQPEVNNIQEITNLRYDDSFINLPSTSLCEEFPLLCLQNSVDDHVAAMKEDLVLDMQNKYVEENTPLNSAEICNIFLNDEILVKEDEELDAANLYIEQLKQHQQEIKTCQKDEESDTITISNMIRQHIKEEFVSLLDKHKTKKEQQVRLVQSHFQVINIPPQINLLEYAQKKLERQLTDPSSPETTQKRCTSHLVASRKSMNIRPSTPKKVTNMFQKFSQVNFRKLEAVIGNDHIEQECNQSDDDSIILDDEEFEKINGHLDERNDKKQNRNNSAYNFTVSREKSNPLKLTVRDMSKVNEKVLNTIGLFTARGDIRPGVIDILEEQKKAKAKDSRNKQFRVRRQWDLKVHLSPKEEITSSFTSASTRSYMSMSSTDIRSGFAKVKNASGQVDYGK